MKREISHTLDIVGPARVEDIAQRIGRHPVRVDQACAHLQREGAIRLEGGDRYRLTEAGIERLTGDDPPQKVDRYTDLETLQE